MEWSRREAPSPEARRGLYHRYMVERYCERAARIGAAILLAAATGCSEAGEPDRVQGSDRAAIAAAKCSLPVDVKAGFARPDGELIRGGSMKEDVEVTDLGAGRYRVTGLVVGRGQRLREARYVCEVEPDVRDDLRGFRVTSLSIQPVRGAF